MKAFGLVVLGAACAMLLNLVLGVVITWQGHASFNPTCKSLGGMPVEFRDGTRICMAPGAGIHSPQGGPTL